MMLNLHVPAHCPNEVRWIIGVIFGEFLGIACNIIEGEQEYYRLEFSGKTLHLADCFFNKASKAWLQHSSLPKMPLASWDVTTSGLDVPLVAQHFPIISGKPEINITEGHISLGLDVFGSTFFMLSRYEEVVKSDRDQHGRFPASASLAFQVGFLDRPIVNEYLEILWSCMKLLWPDLKRKQRNFQMRVSCDVDHPYQCGIKNPVRQLENIVRDLIRRKSPLQAVKSTINYFASKSGNFSFDSNYARFNWMMDMNEKAGNKVAFYFLAGRTSQELDGCYSLDEPVIRRLMRSIHERGHEIGLHPSYNSYQSVEQLKSEANNLRRVMDDEGIHQDILGGRQHYLRWDARLTPGNWEKAELAYDSTLSFSDCAGFRCGTCYEYPLYDLIARRQLNVFERPLVLMESSIISKQYMGLGYSEISLEKMLGLYERCRQFDGQFTLLWHNSHFSNPEDESFYKKLVMGAPTT